MRRAWLGLAALALLISGTAAAVHRSTGPGSAALPVLGPARDMYDGDLGDPYVLPLTAGGYVAFGTGDRPDRVPTAHSSDLLHWDRGPHAMPVLPGWASPDPGRSLSSAPAALETPGRYILYISLREEASQRECITAATSTTPLGPYTDPGDHPFLCQRDRGGSIDPSLVRDRAGALHMLWKSNGNCCDLPTEIWEQGLTADGLGLVGQPHRLPGAGAPWHAGSVEEPAMVEASGGGWWLFYSGNRFDLAEYATGVAYCRDIDGPCVDRSD